MYSGRLTPGQDPGNDGRTDHRRLSHLGCVLCIRIKNPIPALPHADSGGRPIRWVRGPCQFLSDPAALAPMEGLWGLSVGACVDAQVPDTP